MSPSFKLTYFPSEALCEPIRWLLVLADIEFEDFRFNRADWPRIKQDMPFGQVPILEYNGRVYHQSLAIARFAAKKAKLTGDNEWEDLEIDGIIDTINDLRIKIAEYFYEKDEVIQRNLKGPLVSQTIPYYLERLDSIAKNGHLALGKTTWADVYFTAISSYFSLMCDFADILERYPNLSSLRDTILNLQAIKDWISRRPAPIPPFN